MFKALRTSEFTEIKQQAEEYEIRYKINQIKDVFCFDHFCGQCCDNNGLMMVKQVLWSAFYRCTVRKAKVLWVTFNMALFRSSPTESRVKLKQLNLWNLPFFCTWAHDMSKRFNVTRFNYWMWFWLIHLSGWEAQVVKMSHLGLWIQEVG